MATNPVGALTNMKEVATQQLSIQKAERTSENQDFNANVIGHTNPGIKDPGGIMESNTKNLSTEFGRNLSLQIKLKTNENKLNLLA